MANKTPAECQLEIIQALQKLVLSLLGPDPSPEDEIDADDLAQAIANELLNIKVIDVNSEGVITATMSVAKDIERITRTTQ
jgi:hypothetical protein